MKEAIKNLEAQLKGSAFRRGTSAFRFGLIPQAPSDHLPIVATLKPNALTEYSVLSWNMLATDHLYNNFMNVSGTRELLRAVENLEAKGNIYSGSEGRNRLYYFFSELSQYLYQPDAHKIVITPEKLTAFVTEQPSRLARSRDPLKAAKLKIQVEKSRQQIVDILLNEKHTDAHEFKLAIQHSLEIIHHILRGALTWEHRLELIQNNKALKAQLAEVDICCLQECTDPSAISRLLTKAEKTHQILQHRIHERTNDHCAIIFDTAKFELDGEPTYGAIDGKKPYIFVRLKDRQTDERFIVGSIHHPGGHHNKMDTLLTELNGMQPSEGKPLDFYILGDYNHAPEFFKETESLTDHQLIFPEEGTLAGSDFGNTNEAIDGLITNISAEQVSLNRCDHFHCAAPATTPFVVDFKLEKTAVKVHNVKQQHTFFARPSYRQSVNTNCAQEVTTTLEVSTAKRGDPVSF